MSKTVDNNSKFRNVLLKLWPIIVTLFVAALCVGGLKLTVGNNVKDIAVLRTDTDTNTLCIVRIEATIETKFEDLEKDVKDIVIEQKALRKENSANFQAILEKLP